VDRPHNCKLFSRMSGALSVGSEGILTYIGNKAAEKRHNLQRNDIKSGTRNDAAPAGSVGKPSIRITTRRRCEVTLEICTA
jgi:hypothetical protein